MRFFNQEREEKRGKTKKGKERYTSLEAMASGESLEN